MAAGEASSVSIHKAEEEPAVQPARMMDHGSSVHVAQPPVQ